MMKKIRRKLPAVLIVLFAVLFIPGIASAKTEKEYQGNLWNFKQTIKKTSGAFTYYAYPSKNQKEAWIHKIEIKGGKNCGKLSIPSKLDNKKVTRLGSREREYLKGVYDEMPNIFGIGAEPWDKYDGSSKQTKRIKKLVLPNTVNVIQPTAFSGMDSIKTVKIPKKVKRLDQYTFYGCNSLKTVELPAGLKTLDTLAFVDCPKLTKMKLSSKNKTYQVKDKCVITKKKKELVYAMAGGETFQIPDGVKVIKAYAFSNCTSSIINISASVKEMEKNAFGKLNGRAANSVIENVEVDAKNNVYGKDGQCIYNKTDKSLSVAIPNEKGELYISDQVERLTEDYSIINCELGEVDLIKIVYPKKLKTVVGRGFERLDARSTYFTGENPPELLKSETGKNVSLPVNTHVYVPENSLERYKQWYKKQYESVKGWHTFKPEDGI